MARLGAFTVGTFGLLGAITAALIESHALAQPAPWPNKPLRMLNGYAAGGGIDVLGRMVNEGVAEALGQSILIENRPGASSMIGAEAAAKSTPDGHTIFLGNTAYLTAPLLYGRSNYDPIRDFTPIVLLGYSRNVIVVPSESAIRSVGELVAASRGTAGGLPYASLGNGSTQHILAELLSRAATVPFNQVPYKGMAPAIQAVLGGHVPMMFAGTFGAGPQLQSGKFRLVAVAEEQRTRLYPEVPTIVESGFANVYAPTWFAVLGPVGMPEEIVRRLNAEYNRALATATIRERLLASGFDVIGGTREALAEILRGDVDRYRRLFAELRIKPE